MNNFSPSSELRNEIKKLRMRNQRGALRGAERWGLVQYQDIRTGMTDFRITLKEIGETEDSMKALERDAACMDAKIYVDKLRDPHIISFFDETDCAPGELPTLEMLVEKYQLSWTEELKTSPEEIAARRRSNALKALMQHAEYERTTPSRATRDGMRLLMKRYSITIDEVDAAINDPSIRWLARHFESMRGH